MKALSIIILSILIVTASFAGEPFKAETLELGGSVAYHHYGGKRFSNSFYDYASRTEVKVLPEFGYFVIDGLSVGVITGYERFEQAEMTNQIVSVGYRMAYYFLPNPTGSPYINTSYHYGKSESRYSDWDDYSFKSITRDFAVGAGYLFLVNESIGLTTELDYISDSIRYEHDDYYYGPTNHKYDGRRWEVLVGFKIFVD